MTRLLQFACGAVVLAALGTFFQAVDRIGRERSPASPPAAIVPGTEHHRRPAEEGDAASSPGDRRLLFSIVSEKLARTRALLRSRLEALDTHLARAASDPLALNSPAAFEDLLDRLVAEDLALEREEGEVREERREIARLRRGRGVETLAWRRVENNRTKEHMKLQLADLKAEREKLGQKFVPGSVWLKRLDRRIAALEKRMVALPDEVETAREIVGDLLGLMLDLRDARARTRLAALAGRRRVIGRQILALREGLRTCRQRIREHERLAERVADARRAVDEVEREARWMGIDAAAPPILTPSSMENGDEEADDIR